MDKRSCVELNESIVSSGFFDSFDYVLTDCDGVLWIENVPIPGSVETIQALKKMGKHIIYITNNGSKSRVEYIKKYAALGFPATLKDIISTSYCAASYLLSKHFQKKVYIVGGIGIAEELDMAGIPHLPIGPDPTSEDWAQCLSELKLDPEVGAVIVGFDQFISYPKLIKVANYLKNPDNLFIATSREDQFPTEHNFIIPGTGTIVNAAELASDRIATVMGKPERFMLDCIKQNHPDIDFSRCIMIGDKLNTDVMFGTKHGIKTVLVLTGINSLEDVRKFEKSSDEKDHLLVPDYYLQCLGDMQKFIKNY